MSTSKKNQTSIISDWSTMFNQIDHIAADVENKSLYQVEPVDLDTFVSSPEYLNQGLWGMSDAQREYILTGSDFDNDVTFMVLMVGKGGKLNLPPRLAMGV